MATQTFAHALEAAVKAAGLGHAVEITNPIRGARRQDGHATLMIGGQAVHVIDSHRTRAAVAWRENRGMVDVLGRWDGGAETQADAVDRVARTAHRLGKRAGTARTQGTRPVRPGCPAA